MSAIQATSPTLTGVLWPSSGVARLLRGIVLALVGTGILAISAKIQVPFWPVPMTMQTFAVLVIGMAYGWRLGAATVLLYLVEGGMGLPVFASGAGWAYLAGPTGGYLLGFLVAAAVVGWLAQCGWDRKVLPTLLAMTLGTGIIFLLGVAWLSTIVGGFGEALASGMTPFLLGGAFKIVLAAAVLPFAWKIADRFRG